MTRPARLLGLLVMVLAGVGLAPAPASAAYCSSSGVHVVVDYGKLGGGVRQGCMPTEGRVTADRAFPEAGFPLSYVSSQRGAVCRVSGKPASATCADMPPADAYWGLFEAHGGGWAYAQSGVGGVRLEPGDSVAFVWQDGGDTERPGVAPGPSSFPKPKPKPAPKPSAEPKPSAPKQQATRGTKAPQPGSSSSAAVTTEPGVRPSLQPSASPRPRATGKASATASASPTTRASATGTPSGEDTQAAAPTGSLTPRGDASEGGLPGWVPIGLVVGLSGAAAAAVALRRRTP